MGYVERHCKPGSRRNGTLQQDASGDLQDEMHDGGRPLRNQGHQDYKSDGQANSTDPCGKPRVASHVPDRGSIVWADQQTSQVVAPVRFSRFLGGVDAGGPKPPALPSNDDCRRPRPASAAKAGQVAGRQAAEAKGQFDVDEY